jgi:2-oxoglutarate dehydrogenase E2 component (dihydrolipoamide succinyltransferase)
MSRLRTKVAQRLKDAQNTYALLTTFQEVDMSAVMAVRKELGEDFQKTHNIKLGFMSFFIKAAVAGIQDNPIINSVIDGGEVVHRNYVDVSVAVATPTGLLVPVIRNCESQSFAGIERELAALAKKGRDGKITIEEMAGGTFTVSNGGVFGSLMGTPILNPPQSAILGLHAVVNRPVVRGTEIVARPMMYVALTYDHRLLDGKDSATFLKKIQAEI